MKNIPRTKLKFLEHVVKETSLDWKSNNLDSTPVCSNWFCDLGLIITCFCKKQRKEEGIDQMVSTVFFQFNYNFKSSKKCFLSDKPYLECYNQMEW